MRLFDKLKRKGKILVVEDDNDIAESLEARLTLENYEVVRAVDGKDGIEKSISQRPDLILMDIMMPKLNGYETCRMIKSNPHTRHIPIVILTSLQHMGDSEKAFEAGADDYFSKPYTNDKLLRKISKFLS